MTQIHPIFHSGFAVEDDHSIIVFDYWKDPQGLLEALLPTQKQLYFVVSHSHPDHFNPVIFRHTGARFLLAYDVAKKYKKDPTFPCTAILRPGFHYHDENITLSCFRSTDIGVSTALVMPDGTQCFHAGDLNNWYFPDNTQSLKITAEEMDKLFLSIVRDIAKKYSHFDHLMFPIDPRLGAESLRGIQQWLEKISCSHLYPMHCWGEEKAMLEILNNKFPQSSFLSIN